MDGVEVPIWVVAFFAYSRVFLIPLHLVVDTLVLLIYPWVAKVMRPWDLIKNSILRVWLCGILSNIVANQLLSRLLTGMLQEGAVLGPAAPLLWAALGTLLAGGLIYFSNIYFGLEHTLLTQKQKHRAALCLAVFTAPLLYAAILV